MGVGSCYIKYIAATNDNGFIVTKVLQFGEQIGDVAISTKGWDGIIEKFNSNGELEWYKQLAGESNLAIDYIYNIIETKDGGFLTLIGFEGQITLESGETLTDSNGDGILLKYNYNKKGKVYLEKFKQINIEKYNTKKPVIETKDGGIIYADNKSFVKLDSNWNIEFNQTLEATIYSVKETSDGKLLLCGTRNNKGIIKKFDSKGVLEWKKEFGKVIEEVIEKNNKTYVIVGEFSETETLENGQTITSNGNTDGLIVYIKEEMGVPDIQEITVENIRKEIKITTEVKEIDGIKGGSISGENDSPYETVKYGDGNTKEIILTPDEGYEIINITINGEEHQFTANEDGTYTMPAFENIIENKHIVVTYSLKQNKIVINKIDSYTKERLTGAEFRLEQIGEEPYFVEIETNSQGQAIVQIPFGKYILTEIKVPEGYEEQKGSVQIEFKSDGTRTVIENTENIEDESGNIIESPKVTVNEQGEFDVENIAKAKVIVEHYIKGTEEKIAEDVILEGKQGDKYTTSPLLNLKKYELEKDENGEYVIPENASGVYTQENIIVKYYYVKKQIPLTVHHYIEKTTDNVPLNDGTKAEDEVYFGNDGESYTTNPISNENLSMEYELAELPYNKDGVYSGDEIIVTYYYKKVERNIVIQKYQLIKELDEETGEEVEKEVPLAGAEFTITKKTQDSTGDSSNVAVPIYITDENGKIAIKLDFGEYEITEIKAPEGYKLPENPTTIIKITRDTVEGDTIKIVNEKIKGKVIVHHYVMEFDGTLTTTPVPLADGTEAQDETKEGYIGDIYATKEKGNLATNWKFIKAEGKTSGEFIEGTIEVIYYYQEQINVEDTISIEVTKKWNDNDIQALRRPNTIKFIVTPYVELEEGEVIKEEIVSKETLPTNDEKINADPNENTNDSISDNNVVEDDKAQEDTLNDDSVLKDKKLTEENKENNINSEVNIQQETIQKTEDVLDIEIEEEVTENKESEVKQEIVEQTTENIQEETSISETNDVAGIPKNNLEGTENLSVETLEQYIFEFPNQPVNKEEKTTTYILNGIYKYDKTTGKKIHYIVTEVEENEGDLKFYEPTGGVVTEEVDEAGNIKYTAEIVNTFRLPEENSKDIKVTKVWKDNNNMGKTRPSILILDLIGRVGNSVVSEENSESEQYKEINRKEQSITSTQNWQHIFTQNPIYDDNGQEIEYIVEESTTEENKSAFDRYIQEISPINEQNEIIITNTLIIQDSEIIKTGPEEIRAIDSKVPYSIEYRVELDKRYEDNANIELVDTLEYELVAEKSELAGGILGEDKKTVTWTGTYDANENKVIWDNDTQNKVQVQISEDAEKAVKIITIHMEISVVYKDIQIACEKVINKVSGTVTLTNNVTDKKEAICETPTRWVKDVVVNKKWIGDIEETRPDSITVQLKQVVEDENGNEVLEEMEGFSATIIPNTTDDGKTEWTYTYKDLPRYDEEGIELKYTVVETSINYTKGEQVVENQYYCEKAEEIKDGNIIITLTNNKFGTITVTKVDSRKEEVKLVGAEFKLEKMIKDEASGEWIVPEEESSDYVSYVGATTEDGTYTFENLKYGFYKLTETKAPEGYRISKLPIEVIEVNSSDEEHLNVQVTVKNDKKYSLPLTGGVGTDIVRNASILVVSIFTILLTNRKKIVPVKRAKMEKISKPIRRK